jgi:hypothetical protein
MTDIITGGRLDIGIARGAYNFEYQRLSPGLDAATAGQRMRELVPTGIRPQIMRKIERSRIFLAPDFFQPPPELVTTPHRLGR